MGSCINIWILTCCGSVPDSVGSDCTLVRSTLLCQPAINQHRSIFLVRPPLCGVLRNGCLRLVGEIWGLIIGNFTWKLFSHSSNASFLKLFFTPGAKWFSHSEAKYLLHHKTLFWVNMKKFTRESINLAERLDNGFLSRCRFRNLWPWMEKKSVYNLIKQQLWGPSLQIRKADRRQEDWTCV